ncbi:helix-turn-helix domain-containing protein [Candidatus Woesearchaeota archaeon]|nr:helix-turn-helix domain-containing protein [Candidatus Woesearchaeota archaeon]
MIIGYTVEDAVEILDISPKAIRKWCRVVDVEKDHMGRYIISDEKMEEIKAIVRPWSV